MILLLVLCLASAPVTLGFGYLWASSPSDHAKAPHYKAITVVSAAWVSAFLFLYSLGIPSGRHGLILVFGLPAFLTYRYFVATTAS